jgi:hypothetical protein
MSITPAIEVIGNEINIGSGVIDLNSLEDIINWIPVGTKKIICAGKHLKSLRGVERFPASVTSLDVCHNDITSLRGLVSKKGIACNIKKLSIWDNKISSFKGLVTKSGVASKVQILNISKNRITSLRGLAGSNVCTLDVSNNNISSWGELHGLAWSMVTNLRIFCNPIYSEYKKNYYQKGLIGIIKEMENEDDE